MIRAASKSDIDELAVLFDAYRVFYRKQSDLNGAKDFILERLENKDSQIFVNQRADGSLNGFVQLYPIFSSTRMQRHWLLNDLYVDKSERSIGVGKALIDRSKKLANDTGAAGLLLETEKSNDTGNHLYPSVGFKLVDGSNFYEWLV